MRVVGLLRAGAWRGAARSHVVKPRDFGGRTLLAGWARRVLLTAGEAMILARPRVTLLTHARLLRRGRWLSGPCDGLSGQLFDRRH